MRARIGRRGAFLLLFGAAYALTGYAFLYTPTTPPLKHMLRLALDLMPLAGWGVLWLVGAAIMIVSSVMRTGRDWIGFIAAMLLPAWWAVIYFLAWREGDMPRGWVSAALYVALGAAVGVVAGWPEPRLQQ